MNNSRGALSKTSLKIVFMGTPEFAVASLKALLDNGFNVIAVVTAPDKPAGRGMQLQQSAVKQFAMANNLPVLQPLKFKDPEFIAEMQALQADLNIVVAFRMLPEVIWRMPPLGTINVHGSLLPQYRGAAPINWAIINGEKQTGVTTFKLQHEIDTGNILLQDTIAISENETAGDLHDEMMHTGATLLVKTLEHLINGTLEEQSQQGLVADTNEIKHAPKIFTDTCRIDWNEPVEKIYNLIRGLSPYPGAFTSLNNKTLKIFSCEKEISEHAYTSGELLTDGKSWLKFACPGGFISLLEIQLEGKKRMAITDFLRGFRMP